ncbi:MAG: GNAT family N-acetyltransferase [Spirochaetales bacterium]
MSDQRYSIRPYEHDRDQEEVDRIYREVGWLGSSVPKARAEQRERFARDSVSFVAEINNTPECYAATFPGTYCYHGHDLAFSGVASVITSRIARKQGLASRLTARAVAQSALDGAVISGLGMFDQGFYDKLGYGHGAYDTYVMLDPANLNVPHCRRVPVRLSAEDAEEMHAARLTRLRRHGAVSLATSATTALMARRTDAAFGLGFRDDSGTLTHHIWVNPDGGSGPYRVLWMAYSNLAQFVELLGLLRNLGDQVYLVRLVEPGGVQLQDFLDRPFRRHAEAKGGRYETYSSAVANFQYRILHVTKAFAAVSTGERLDATLRVVDPIEKYLINSTWPGVAGDYAISLARESRAEAIKGKREGGIDISADVGTLTRLWLGVLPASTLRGIRALECTEEMASTLDSIFYRGLPHTDWSY